MRFCLNKILIFARKKLDIEFQNYKKNLMFLFSQKAFWNKINSLFILDTKLVINDVRLYRMTNFILKISYKIA